MNLRRYTFTLSLGRADPNTYPNWSTAEFRSDGNIFRLTNMSGNGQSWEHIGTFANINGQMAYWLCAPTDEAMKHGHKVMNTVLTRKGARPTGYAGLFGFCLDATMIDVTGKRVTAAPTLANGGIPPRDKNETPALHPKWLGMLATAFGMAPATTRARCAGTCAIDTVCADCGA